MHNDVRLEKFARYEFKYVLAKVLGNNIEAELLPFMIYDGHTHPELGNTYIVRSLYFDNKWSTNYYQKIDGEMNRRKYRLRTYSKFLDPSVPIYLEEKGRTNQRTYKRRIPIQPEHIPYFEDIDHHEKLLSLYPGNELVEAFVYDSIRKELSPVVLVDYTRRPYTSEFDMNFRATFDGDLKAAASGCLFPGGNINWVEFESGFRILEVKFHRRIPAWFHRNIQAYNLSRVSISKFCRGMEVCNIATNLE